MTSRNYSDMNLDSSDEDNYNRGQAKSSRSSSSRDYASSSRAASDGPSVSISAAQATPRSINEILTKALDEAANPGVGDEEPEVLPAPTEGQPSSEDRARQDEIKRKKEEEKAHLRRLEEEELRVAALKFDDNFLVPFENMRERAKYIPVRLTYEERKSLRLVNAAINVSDYTNVVDLPFKSASKRQHTQLQQVVAFLSGLVAAIDYDKGQQVLDDRNFIPFESLIQDLLEIARRYKITNPEKMRSEYGKLIYLMQDAVSDSIKPLLGIDVYKPIKTVYAFLESCGGLAALDDPQIATATEEIIGGRGKDKYTIQLEVKRKEKAVENIVRKYTSSRLDSDSLRLCLYSISDNNSFLNSNKKPVEDCIELLKKYFSPRIVNAQSSLAINEGSDGARLSHSHEMQFNYVHQSLSLWSAILNDMFRLWYLSEQDLLSEATRYDLRQTGQGLQRVQQSARVYRSMHEILAHTKTKLGNWVGSSVIHLGDNNVPNALVFIDKYTQVARILGPLVKTLDNIELAVTENEGIGCYIDAYGGLDKAKQDILRDFFTHGFDGSGGDNFFDAGSCIDGRLTSAWNWCSQLSSKPYYPLFRLTGFLSFDGEFDK